MSSCSLNFDFRIEKGDPSNLKIAFMIGHKFIANAYIDLDLPMNVMSLACYNAIRHHGYKIWGQNFIGIGRDMHVFVGNMSRVMDFTILKNIEDNINPSLSQGHDLLSFRVILSKDDCRRGCERASDLERGFYIGMDKLGPSYKEEIERVGFDASFEVDSSSSNEGGVT
ncbi:hypothetical protein Tco_1232931 [Tanacetum coccineum]